MSFVHLFLLPISFIVGCQGDLPALQRAIELEEKGAKLTALKQYEDILNRYPDHESSVVAIKRLENLYNETANRVRLQNPEAAYIITNAQINRFPDGQYTKEAKSRIDDLGLEKELYLARKKEDKNACKTAQSKAEPESWKTYLTSFPTGDCAREGRDELRRLDSNLCKQAQKGGSKEWREYLRSFPKGSCAEEAMMKVRQDPLPSNKATTARRLVQECSRLSQRCKGLSDRHYDIIERNDPRYLIGNWADHLRARLEDVGISRNIALRQIQRYEEEGFDVAELSTYYEDVCLKPCAASYDHLKEIRACQEADAAIGAQSSDLWEAYMKEYPKGGCITIARP